jgi:adenine-specific DNA-methyltransferase
MATNSRRSRTVATLTYQKASRKNIPTAEYQSVIGAEVEAPVQVAYQRRNRDLDPQLVWRGKDQQDWSDLVVQAPPLYIQEKIHPKVLIDDLLRRSEAGAKAAESQLGLDLFDDFNGLTDPNARTEFYQHDAHWSNRMILGDSLQVMASLAEREGLRGQVQCIYIDPPYGIRFNSNFQWSTTSRDVQDGKVDHITREPEQVKAFRDTWRDGTHSYLTYLRDRLTVCRGLLADTGAVFVQIGDENLHRVRALMDEVFGESNFVALITAVKTSSATSEHLAGVSDYVLYYAKDARRMKYRGLFFLKALGGEGSTQYRMIADRNTGQARRLSKDELAGDLEDRVTSVFAPDNLTSQRPPGDFPVRCDGREFRPGKGYWKTHPEGFVRLGRAQRLLPIGKTLMYRRYLHDFPVYPIANLWRDVLMTGFSEDKVYVVQSSSKIVERCLLMATDPGDLVLDPTCGSGTTACVAEQWGRRWITIDTSRVALALARARIMGARYPFYLLADSPEGQRKEAEITRTAPSSRPTHGDIRQGFVYERVPHITLKSIANNAEIDVIWKRFQETLEPLRAQLNQTLGKSWEEWEIPREADPHWPPATSHLHSHWWEQRIARQKEIDASIAAKADYEYLYDRPFEDRSKVRVAGPFTVESLSPHRVLGVDEDGELIDDRVADGGGAGEGRDFVSLILENLKSAGVQQAHKEDRIRFTALTPWPGELVCAEGLISGEWSVISGQDARRSPQATSHSSPATNHYRAAIFIGPEFGTVSRPDLVQAAREAGDAGFDVLIACAFNYDAHSTEFAKLGRIPVLKARMNADLHMAEDLKSTGKGNLFVIFGEPDIEVVSGLWLVASSGRLVANYDLVKELSGLGSLEEINRLGGADLPRLKELSAGRAVRVDRAAPQGGGLGAVEHRGGGGPEQHGRVPSEPERGERLAGGGGDATDHRGAPADAVRTGPGAPPGAGDGDRQDARRAKALAELQTLTAADFPLSLTTSHKSQVTVYGVDVFHPNTGEVRSDGPEGIACWFIDTDYNEESFFVRHAYFLGANDPYKALKMTLKAEIDEEAWATLHSDTSRPFDRPESGRVAVKVINHLGDEVMKVLRVA